MDPEKQHKELQACIARAKRAGLTVHHYPDAALAILRIPPVRPPVATDTPPAGAPPAQPPPAQ